MAASDDGGSFGTGSHGTGRMEEPGRTSRSGAMAAGNDGLFGAGGHGKAELKSHERRPDPEGKWVEKKETKVTNFILFFIPTGLIRANLLRKKLQKKP